MISNYYPSHTAIQRQKSNCTFCQNTSLLDYDLSVTDGFGSTMFPRKLIVKLILTAVKIHPNKILAA